MKQTKPNWFKQKIHSTPESKHVRALLSSLSLNTVCSEAACPNRNRCYADGTATFLILGKNCTRNCRFCNIGSGTPEPVDPGEPERVALAAKGMELSHVVITSVTRDDLPDGGANHFAETVRWIRDLLPEASIELLVPDFGGSESSLRIVLDSGPDVLNHNVETVPDFYPEVRPGADYRRSLDLLEISSDEGFVTKSGIMLGFGESDGYYNLGSGKWGTTEDAFLPEETHFIQQYENNYIEEFIDDDFKGTGTATWSGSLTFTSGQIGLSTSIDYNNGTITQATLTSTEVSGSFIYQMTANGTNFENVTSGTEHTFTNSGTDLKWRVAENNTSTGEISKVEISSFH